MQHILKLYIIELLIPRRLCRLFHRIIHSSKMKFWNMSKIINVVKGEIASFTWPADTVEASFCLQDSLCVCSACRSIGWGGWDDGGGSGTQQLNTRSLIHVCTDRLSKHTNACIYVLADAHTEHLRLMTESITRAQRLLVILYAFLL